MLVTTPSTRSLWGVVKTSSVGMLGLQTMPFFAVVAPPCPVVVVGEPDASGRSPARGNAGRRSAAVE